MHYGSSSQLDSFLILARGQQGLALQKLVLDVLENSSVFVFGELLAEPNIQQLQNTPDCAPYYRLLEVFAYGTYSDYVGMQGQLPQLTQNQIKKLRLLTLVSLASCSKVVPYDHIFTSLDLNDIREVEDLIIDSNYKGRRKKP